MANANRPSGARQVGSMGSTSYRVNRYSVPASDGTALFVGDFVISNGTADTDGTPQVIQAIAGGNLRGVVVGFEPDPDNLSIMHRLASTHRYALVADDPDAVFEIQEDSVGNSMPVTDVGSNADIALTVAGSAISGRSGMELDSTSAATTAAQLRILSLVQREDNAIGDQAKWLVRINEHELASTTGD